MHMTKIELIDRLEKEFQSKITVKNLPSVPDDFLFSREMIIFTCIDHGEFRRLPSVVFSASRGGCPQCNRVKGRFAKSLELLEIFKVEAPKKFNNKFTYDYSTFKGHRSPMRMVCPDHGEFWTQPSRHLYAFAAGGCRQCDIILKRKSRSDTDEEWFAKAREVHDSKYEYLSITPIEEVPITQKRRIFYNCPVHGKRSQLLVTHVFGKHGCLKCRNVQTSINYLKDPKDVIDELEILFPGKLSYDKFIYRGGVELFTLICREHHTEFETNLTNIRTHPEFYSCPICSPRCDSSIQRFISDSLIKIGLKTKYNDRKSLSGKEIDILIPELKLGIEYNGVFWHSEKWMSNTRDAKWHMLEKQQLAREEGIELVHFNSTIPSKKIINFIKFKAGKTKRVFARNTTASRVEQQVAEAMLDELHLQGSAKGCASYGLFKGGELLGVASFSQATSERGNKNRLRWELRRLVFNCHVVGGASKLLKTFLRDHPEVTSLISYSDTRWFTGGVYIALGFEHVKDCPLDYAYTRGGYIFHKSQFKHSVMKHKQNFNYDPNLSEVQNCHANGYFRIWDCGKKKWELTLRENKNGKKSS